MPEHFLLKNAIPLPQEALIRSNQSPNDLLYLTKTAGRRAGDDDDYYSSMNLVSGWNNSFLTKTLSAPGDDDDYSGITSVWASWESLLS